MAKKTVAKTKPTGVTVMFRSLGRTFKGEGKTFDDAIRSIKVSGGIKTASVLAVKKDGVEKSKIINGRHAQALFGGGSPTTRMIHVKQVKAMFGV